MNSSDLALLDTITDATADHSGRVVVAGSHGGLYAATLASRAGIRAVILNDAGVGFDEAGVAGVLAAAQVGMAAAAADCMSCEIGRAADCLDQGTISRANSVAEGLGLHPGMLVSEAVALLEKAPPPSGQMAKLEETRREITIQPDGPSLVLVDSASLVRAEDAGRIVVTGSHGGLVGNDPRRGFKAAARVAVFNDAGIGKNRAAVSRLPALDPMGVAGVAVSHTTARIGDATSVYETGVISTVNDTAARLGASPGTPLRDWLATL
ncbi:MAG: hypothetical protein AAFY02_11650 [Pseudomonadota bacterium]